MRVERRQRVGHRRVRHRCRRPPAGRPPRRRRGWRARSARPRRGSRTLAQPYSSTSSRRRAASGSRPPASTARRQVAEGDAAEPALRLRRLAGIVDDERIDHRQRRRARAGPAVGRQRHGLAGQPFRGAVRAEMDQRVEARVPQPEVEREIGVRRRHVGVVVAGLAVGGAAAVGLEERSRRELPQRRGAARSGTGTAPSRQAGSASGGAPARASTAVAQTAAGRPASHAAVGGEGHRETSGSPPVSARMRSSASGSAPDGVAGVGEDREAIARALSGVSRPTAKPARPPGPDSRTAPGRAGARPAASRRGAAQAAARSASAAMPPA